MGDFLAPKRKDVVDKLRRRLERYRSHSQASGNRYFGARPSILEQQKQETYLLQQRWLESKAKKAAKQSKASRDNSSQSDHRNLLVNKLKQKIEPSVTTESTTSTGATPTTASETIFNFSDKEQHPKGNKNSKANSNTGGGTGGGGGGGGAKHNSLPSLSVQIVQQISGHPQQDTSQTIHTNVTVSSLYGSSNSPNQGGASHSVLTSVQCKQEPSDGAASSSNNNTPTSSSSVLTAQIDHSSVVGDLGIHNYDIDEIQDILDSIEKEDNIEPSLLRDLNEFNEIFVKVQRDSESNESANMFGSLACVSPGLSSKTIYSSLGPGGSLGSIFDPTQTMTNPSSIPVPSAIPEHTGPAAETLKQMAAQHQHQHSPGYPMDHFSNGGFPPNYSQLYRSVPNTASPFPYSHSAGHHLGDGSQMAPDMVYGATKPLTHYSTEQAQHNSPSSLQQLQNQVQSHFKPSAAQASPHQMQIIQSQQLQVSHGAHSMQMSQSQQVQMQPSSQPISMSQQQNFSLNQQQLVSEQMKMQMMEKMRMEQQQQARMAPQYMNRPPPEYKMHPNARTQGNFPNPAAPANNSNPLQTMQNMVNQTTSYGTIKSEVTGNTTSQGVNGMMQPTQMAGMQQQQSMSGPLPSNGSHIGNISQVSPNVSSGFHPQQQLQQPPAYSTVDATTRNSSSTYTSAIMRNQRPPNMNVGPDGLNIAQPRTNTDWPRTSMMNNQHAGIRPVMQAATHGMAQSSMSAHMMQYQRSPHYGTGPSSGTMATSTSSMAQMQQQQQARAPSQANRVGHSMMPGAGQMVMQQHQSMQVTQQMNIHGSSPGFSMGGPSPGATNTGYSMGGPSPGATNTGYSMGGPSPSATNTGYSTGGPSPGAPNTGYNMGGPSPGATSTSTTGYNMQSQSQQQSSVNQTTGFPGPPSTRSNADEFYHFLDPQPMFDSLQGATSDDFNLFEDILNEK